jgi:MGT family glycosyltransferase
MTNAYLLALTDGGGTVPPELGVARRLLARGHRVSVLAEDSMAPEVAASGAELQRWTHALNRADRLPQHAVYREWEIRNPKRLLSEMIQHLIVDPAAGYARDVTTALRSARPDLVLVSFFAFGAMVAAEAEGVPFDVLMPNIYPLPAPGMPPFGLGSQPAMGMVGRLRDRAIAGMGQRLWDSRILPGLNALREDHGLAPLRHYQDQVHRARRELVMTSAAFDFPAVLPASARYVGPVLDDPSWAEAKPWTPPPGDAPLVLVAMSTTFQNQLGCLQRVIDALANLRVRAVVTTGPALDPGALTAPSNVSVVASAPHREVMRHAALVVTHGGHGTLLKAFSAGLPVVVLHHGRDQADNAARVTWRGVGVAVPRDAKPGRIAEAVRRVLGDPALLRAAAHLGDAVRHDADSGRLLQELETLGDHVDTCDQTG